MKNADDPIRVYIGTYTAEAESAGVYVGELDQLSGALGQIRPVADLVNPTYLTRDPGGRFLFVAHEECAGHGAPTGAVSAFAIEPMTGGLQPINRQPSAGILPCFVSVQPNGRYLLVANYTSGSIAALPFGSDGRLGVWVTGEDWQMSGAAG